MVNSITAPLFQSANMFRSQRQAQLYLLSIIILTGLAWAVLGPIQLGGPVSYVIINGSSMEPEINKGDLVVARRQSLYAIGDRVVYAHPDLGYVFHRIVDRDHSQFILQGDNNGWLDSYHPSPDEIIGSFWFSISGAGNLIKAIRKPFMFTVFVMIVAIVSGVLLYSGKDHGAWPRARKGNKMSKNTQPLAGGDYRQELILTLGIIALLALILGVASFTKPLTKIIPDDLFYTHSDEFSYRALDPAGIYDHSGIETGDPLYPTLNCSLELSYRYQLLAERMSDLEKSALKGNFKMVAVLSDQDGWHRTYLLIPDYSFTGTSIGATPAIDICSLLDKIETKELKTGVEKAYYTLSIQPQVSLTGSIAGIDFQDDYQPSFNFQLEKSVLRFMTASEGEEVPRDKSLATTVVIPNTISILGWEITVRTARQMAAIALGLALLGAIYPVWSLIQDWNRSPIARILVQYQAKMVRVTSRPPIPKGYVRVEMTSIDDLVRIAERYGMMILHAGEEEEHHFSLQVDGIYYEYLPTSTESEDDAET